MSEVTFAKSFLATLDKRSIKLAADHVSDPRQYPSQSPYTLPKQSHPFPKRAASTTTASSTTLQDNVTVTLKPMRGGAETVVLEKESRETTVHDIKTVYAEKTGLAVEKVKLLFHKKPAADLKTLSELGVKDDKVEFSVMVMGGGGAGGGVGTPGVSGTSAAGPPVIKADEGKGNGKEDKMDIDDDGPESERAQLEAEKTEHGDGAVKEMLKGDEFWGDLEGFLTQRLRDEKEGKRLAGVFKNAWKKS